MDISKAIHINRTNLIGINRPQLVLEGYINDDVEFEILVDGKKKKYDLINPKTSNRFYLKTKLKKKDKNIVVNTILNKKKTTIFEVKNTLLKRVLSKFSNFFYRAKKDATTNQNLINRIKYRSYMRKKFFYYDNPTKRKEYKKWTENTYKNAEYKKLKYKPLISILIPTYNIKREYLSECLDSILNQTYKNFEICIADDNSSLKETIDTLKDYEEKDERIKVVYRKKNGMISKATNSALEIAKGEYIGLMDNDDFLEKDALYEMVSILNKNKKYEFIYSDEDKIDMKGRICEPHFKSDFSLDSLYGGNYICHFEIFKKDLIDKIGGFRSEYDGAQDFDLFLRLTENLSEDKIYHIPKVLYHWRKVPGSTADTIENKDYAIIAGQKAVKDSLKRRNIEADVIVPIKTTHYIVKYKYKKEPLISIIIDSCNNIVKMLNSIYDLTKYNNYEVIVINGNKDLEKEYDNLKIYKSKSENIVERKNKAAEKAKGDYLVFLDKNTYIMSSNWLDMMVGYAMQKHIGFVSPKIILNNNVIKSAGIAIRKNKYLNLSEYNNPVSYGLYGRLLVPYTYSCVCKECSMIEKEKFNKLGKYSKDYDNMDAHIDLNIRALDQKYKNIVIPLLEVNNEDNDFNNDTEIYLKKDKYYNDNFEINSAYFLREYKKDLRR